MPNVNPRAPAVPFVSFFTQVLKECKNEVTAYGACIQRRLSSLERGACAKEFTAMSTCSVGALARARSGK
jgi:hypothetical protein